MRKIHLLDSLNGNLCIEEGYHKKHGLCVHLVPREGQGDFKLTAKQARALIAILRNWLAENELPAPVGDGIQESVEQWWGIERASVFTDDY